MTVEFFVFLILFSVLIGVWANAWGRNAVAWGLVAFILSPLLVGVVLLIAGKTVEKKAQEAKFIADSIK